MDLNTPRNRLVANMAFDSLMRRDANWEEGGRNGKPRTTVHAGVKLLCSEEEFRSALKLLQETIRKAPQEEEIGDPLPNIVRPGVVTVDGNRLDATLSMTLPGKRDQAEAALEEIQEAVRGKLALLPSEEPVRRRRGNPRKASGAEGGFAAAEQGRKITLVSDLSAKSRGKNALAIYQALLARADSCAVEENRNGKETVIRADITLPGQDMEALFAPLKLLTDALAKAGLRDVDLQHDNIKFLRDPERVTGALYLTRPGENPDMFAQALRDVRERIEAELGASGTVTKTVKARQEGESGGKLLSFRRGDKPAGR